MLAGAVTVHSLAAGGLAQLESLTTGVLLLTSKTLPTNECKLSGHFEPIKSHQSTKMPSVMPRIAALTIPRSILLTTSMSIRQLDHLRAPLRLTSLPPEIMVCIFQSCSILSRINLALTCRHLAKSAVVNRLLSFDTGSKAAGREIVRNDEFVPFSIICVTDLHSRIARRPFLKLEYLPTGRVRVVCVKCGFRGSAPTLCAGLKRHAKMELEEQGGLCTQGIMVLLDRKLSIIKDDWQGYLNNRAFVTLKYKRQSYPTQTLE